MTSMEKGLGSIAAAAGSGHVSARTKFSLRVLRLVINLRLLVALALFGISLLALTPPLLGYRYPELYQYTAFIYLLTSSGLALIILRMPEKAEPAAMWQLIIDIIAITIIVHTSGGVRSGIEGLLVLFVATAGITLPRKLAYLGAAMAALSVLAEQVLSYSQGITETGDFVQAGIFGAIMLLIAFSTQPLLRQIDETEALARQRGIDLADLAKLNEYIIQNLRESIVVVDADTRIRLLNQSAADLLGTTRQGTGTRLRSIAPQLNTLLENWRSNASGDTPTFLANDGTLINTYIAPLGPDNKGPALLFLEDASILVDKVQQSKLAALGRLSASIAHEIRNPIGALSHAGQLLAESPAIGKQEQRFLDIIQKNSKRVSAIVDNVLDLSRKEVAHPEQFSLNDWCREFTAEFISTVELNEGELSVHADEDDVLVRIDPGHLHQVAWNLCENAIKSAGKTTCGIAVEMHVGRRANNRRPYLKIVDHGLGVPKHLQENLFEPFAAGPDGGTGLGLFICRELCEQNKATLHYLPGDNGGSIFQVVFADPSRWDV
ncbi:MAG: two-component system sensor histidine kinase PilS (NtrC family) [Gammaproteobacteria bacterium]|jgi:two-component system sensor histidine kinase PilS (NtrC family)